MKVNSIGAVRVQQSNQNTRENSRQKVSFGQQVIYKGIQYNVSKKAVGEFKEKFANALKDNDLKAKLEASIIPRRKGLFSGFKKETIQEVMDNTKKLFDSGKEQEAFLYFKSRHKGTKVAVHNSAAMGNY